MVVEMSEMVDSQPCISLNDCLIGQTSDEGD